MDDVLTWALRYAERGWHVLPIRARGKVPLTKWLYGNQPASTDPDVIRAWWTRWPDANVAIATGLISHLTVIDVDSAEGERALLAIFQRIGKVRPLAIARTGRPDGSGQHLYYWLDKKTRSINARGIIDVKAEGGYVVAPPSIHSSGNLYQWVRYDTRTPAAASRT